MGVRAYFCPQMWREARRSRWRYAWGRENFERMSRGSDGRARATLRSHAAPYGLRGAVRRGPCATADADGAGGVYLFPGEETLYAGVPWAKATPCEMEGADAHILLCNGTCERALRPLGCRIFPLTPVLRRSGWGVRMDWRAWAMCPLMRYGTKGLNPAFVQAVEVAMREIARSEEGADFLRPLAEAGEPVPPQRVITQKISGPRVCEDASRLALLCKFCLLP